MTQKERYHEFCIRQPEISIFSQDWWMDAVCGPDNWDVYLVGNGMDIKAAFVYYLVEEEGKKKIQRPLMTQNNGIWIKYPKDQGVAARQRYEEKIVNEVCEYIESLGVQKYEQQYHYCFTNWLPFFWRRYKEITRYTYVIEDTGDYETVKNNYSSKIKNEMRKAEKYLTVQETDDLREFYTVNKMTFDRQGIPIPHSYELFEHIYEECKRNHAGILIKASDNNETTHCVAMLVWDNNSVYFLLNGTNPELKMYQGNLLLMDYGIKLAHKMGKKFDFEGSVIKNVNHVFREFGGIPKPYFRIYKEFE